MSKHSGQADGNPWLNFVAKSPVTENSVAHLEQFPPHSSARPLSFGSLMVSWLDRYRQGAFRGHPFQGFLA
jgi:hypothetical protein